MKDFSVNGRQIFSYLERSARDRGELRNALDDIRRNLPETVIFGGMIRDFALRRARVFSSDIDMVSLASDAEIESAINLLNPKRNKFGGFRFSVGKWSFDIWSLHQTWAFKNGLVSGGGFDDLLDTTFFNVDSAICHLHSRAVFTSKRFDSGMRNRILDVNLEQNPSPHGMARRAIRMALENNFAMSERLVAYIIQQISYRPSWLSENVWVRLLDHNSSGSGPLQLYEQLELLTAGRDSFRNSQWD